MMCDLKKISKPTEKLFTAMKTLQKGTKDATRYLLGVNGLNRVVLTDMRVDNNDIYGNREVQKFCREKLNELKKTVTAEEYKAAMEGAQKFVDEKR